MVLGGCEMTREERKTYIKAFYATAIYGELEHLVDEVYGDFEAQLKAKDEEIEELQVLTSDLLIEGLLNKKEQDAKARSIVAMLFWEWKKDKRLSNYIGELRVKNIFNKAYKMLKEQQ